MGRLGEPGAYQTHKTVTIGNWGKTLGVAALSSAITAAALYFAYIRPSSNTTSPSSPHYPSSSTTSPNHHAGSRKQSSSQIPLIPSSMDRMKEILKYGYPGPISDKLYRNAYVGSFNRQTRNAHWVCGSVGKHPFAALMQ
jgi:hypothetical protein